MLILLNKTLQKIDSEESMLVLTGTFTKFSQAFITSNQKAITIAKILEDKWFYICGIPACIHSNKGQSFDNEIMTHLYAMYGIEQWNPMPYNPYRNLPTKSMAWAGKL